MEFRIIRGERLLQAILEEEQLDEKSFTGLQQSTIRFQPPTKKRQYATGPIKIAQMQLIPAVPSRILKVEAVAQSEQKTYDPVLQFSQIDFDEEDTDQNVTFMGSDGEQYHIVPISLMKQNVQVKCTCLDFFYRFASYNFVDGSLYGQKPPPYRRKTMTRPPANILKIPGLCKHLIKTGEALKQSGLVVA
jgi:hypothetical protein